MKTSTILLALASSALASANVFGRQDTTSSAPAAVTSPALTAQESCLAACPAADVNCRADCVGAAHPDTAQVNQTYDCISACPQGDGTQASQDTYAACKATCINSYYLPNQTLAPVTVVSGSTQAVATASAGTASAGTASAGTTQAAASGTSGASSASGSATATTGTSASGTGSAAATSTSANAANGPMLVSAGGLLGLFVAFFAL